MERNKLKKEAPKRPAGIFYIESNRGFYYEPTLPSPIAFDFTPDMVSDLEVTSKKKLDSAIQAFIGNYKIVPKSIIIILSQSVTFEKDFAQGTVQMDVNIQEFLDLVPFQDYISKQSKLPGKIKVVAANRELCEAVKASFNDLGFAVNGIIPLSLCLEVMPQLQTNLDLGLILDKSTEIRDFNLTSNLAMELESLKNVKKDNKRLFMLIGVFAFLMLIFAFVLFKYIFSTPKTPTPLPTTSVAPPVPTVFNKEPSPSSEINSPLNLSTESANTGN